MTSQHIYEVAQSLFKPDDLLSFFAVDHQGIHPIVREIKNTCTSTNMAVDELLQWDPLCETWVNL